ncbi:hypothetical protein J6590_035792 [Homalodisca vitripennis]|nr:hypothetical protein J6590_035792 [Homalodisca vitripennis]
MATFQLFENREKAYQHRYIADPALKTETLLRHSTANYGGLPETGGFYRLRAARDQKIVEFESSFNLETSKGEDFQGQERVRGWDSPKTSVVINYEISQRPREPRRHGLTEGLALRSVGAGNFGYTGPRNPPESNSTAVATPFPPSGSYYFLGRSVIFLFYTFSICAPHSQTSELLNSSY